MSTESGRSAPRIPLWSLSEDVLVEGDPGDDHVVVITRWGETKIDDVDGTVRESLRRMSMGPISLGNVMTDNGAAEWKRLHRILGKLGGSVVHSLGTERGGAPMLSVVPVARDAVFEVADVDPTLPVRLSRFAALRSSDGELLVESPLARFQVVLHRRMVSRVVVAMCAPTSIAELARALDIEQDVVADIVAYLVATGIVLLGRWQDREPARVPRFAEDADPALVRWSHHDLLFHARTRMGRHGGLTGVTFPHADTSPPPAVVKTPRTGPRYPLRRPSAEDLAASDPPLLDVVENTRLCQEMHGPVSADQIGELLFRAARVRSVSPASAGRDHMYEVSDRPYLSINGLYELEIYLCVNESSGLPRGIFHYHPQDHALTLVSDAENAMVEVLENAMVGTGAAQWPPAMITITARVARSSWMYGGIAYSLTLTHVGALQQMLCISATAMGLAACVPAIDPGDAIDTALGLEWPAEVGVGEFVFGNRHPGLVRRESPL
ncbi:MULTISPECIES: SagB family peptide dehydrogenase [Actinokineospora]|uniref:SagB family peptide dehydrogenase n=1 Tax=Actinokineospora TaxID=39845 RepID=UPI001670402D|nr:MULTISPECIES: SagB family peptide dehydrogenase [Actinokineospora]UVS79991.1 SagB-type dehydrogenase domain protein [Actinokineospora sp. UTMC 2448]